MAARILRGVVSFGWCRRGLQQNETRNEEVLTGALKTLEALLVASPEALFTNSPETASMSNDPAASVEELAYGQPPQVEEASKLVRSSVVPQVVAGIFKSSERALKERWTPALLLHFVQLTKALIDREVPPLNAVDSRAWSAAVLKCLERVSSLAFCQT